MPMAEVEVGPQTIPRAEIEQQLARMLESHHFCHSHRYPALLKFLVQETQEGKSALLKERLLGIEVFHRAADYDTNTDPVVRVTAAEVRKRIAQYYQEPEHANDLRIEIPTGSYVPRFGRPAATAAAGEIAGGANTEQKQEAEESRQAGSARRSVDARVRGAWSWHSNHWIRWSLLAVALCLGAVLTFAGLRSMDAWRERSVREFWRPLSTQGQPLLIVIGDHTIDSAGNAVRPGGVTISPSEDVLHLMNDDEQVTLSDSKSLFKIIDFLARHDQAYTAAGAGPASLDDLRTGPVLLFAGLDNRWTMRLSEHLRYRFVDSPDDGLGTIVDAQTPGRQWQVDFKVPYSKMPMDYAIVARYFDPLTEQPVMVAAGIGETGTVSASEFVTTERLIEDMYRLAPKGWKRGNMEVVLATPVVDGHPGPSHIVASQFW
jgi:hypothetical protein